MSDDPRNPVDEVLDLVLFAPLGLALTVTEELPGLARKGRQRWDSQIGMARMIGQFAVSQGQREATKLLGRLGAQAEDLVGGLTGRGAPTPMGGTASQASPAAPAGNGASANGSGNGRRAVDTTPRPSAEGSNLAIPGYDTLAASQVVPRLAGLDPTELEAVRAYEEATRGRKTILSRIAQLQSESA